MTTATEICTRNAAERESLFKSADDILLSLVREECDPNQLQGMLTSEHRLLFDTLGWDRREIKSQFARCQRVHSKLAQLERLGSLESAEQRVADANAAATEIPKLREKIAKLEAQIAPLEREQRESTAVVDEIKSLHKQLRGSAPQHVKDRHAAAIAEMKAETGGSVGGCRRQVDMLRNILTLRYGDDGMKHHCLALDDDHPCHAKYVDDGSTRKVVLPGESAWTAYAEECRRELPEAELDVQAAIEQRADHVEECDKILDCYLQPTT